MIIGLLALFGLSAWADDDLAACDFSSDGFSIHILTVSPGDTVDKIFGHTAIIVYDPSLGEDSIAYDFGWVDMSDPMLVWDILNATQDYRVGRWTLEATREKISRLGRGAIAQKLDVSPTQVHQIANSLVATTRGDSTFRYNWYRPNCTTKVSELIDGVLRGDLKAQHTDPSGTSPAREVLRHSAHMPSLWFGLHWGSGRVADEEISWWDAMFLPEPLMIRLRQSTLASPDGTRRPLVSSECRLLDPDLPEPLALAPNRNLPLGGIGLLMGLAVAGAGVASRRSGIFAVGALGAGLGLFGCAALIVGLAGTFAPFWGHHNLWFASPLSSGLAIAAVIAHRRPDNPQAKWIAAGVLALGVLGVAASALHGFADRNIGIAALILPALAAALWVLARKDGREK